MAMGLTAKWSMAAAIGLALGCAGPVASANDGRFAAATVAYAGVSGALPETSVADNSANVIYVPEPGNDRYDPYTCTAAYGDEFCAAFERCMAAHGFERCYKRFGH